MCYLEDSEKKNNNKVFSFYIYVVRYGRYLYIIIIFLENRQISVNVSTAIAADEVLRRVPELFECYASNEIL